MTDVVTAQNAAWYTEFHTKDGTAFSLRIREKLHEETSEFQHIAVYQTTDFGKLLVLDGCLMVTDRDNFLYHEMMSHPLLFTHPNPQKIAIIGGGDCGTLREVLKHPNIEIATQIDIDERVTRVCEKFFPDLCASNNDPRAKLLFADGIHWIKTAKPGSLDAVIIDSTDPVGPGEVLFTQEFYQACHQALAADGLLIAQSESPLVHTGLIQRMQQNLHQAGFASTALLNFPQPIYPSGWWSATLASKQNSIPQTRFTDITAKGFATRYYNAEIHQAALALPEFLRQ